MKIINKATGEEFDFENGVSFEQAVQEILDECVRINKVYPEEHCVIDRKDLAISEEKN